MRAAIAAQPIPLGAFPKLERLTRSPAAEPCPAAMTDDRPILFFDPGMGGLSVLAPTAALLPHAPLV